MKKSRLIVLALSVFIIISSLQAAIPLPTVLPLPNGNTEYIFWGGPKQQVENNTYICPTENKVECVSVICGGNFVSGQTIPSGTRVHIWNNYLSGPNGITNAILSSSWDTNSGIEPTYTTDSYSAIVTDHNIWENATLIQ